MTADREDKPAPPPPRQSRGLLSRLPLVSRTDVPELAVPLADGIKAGSPKVDLAEVIRAFHYADEAHDGQMRKSGEPYITHPVAVATELAGLGLDTPTIVAALLHDVVEDTPATRSEIEEYFGSDVALLVDGVTKLDRLAVDSKQAQQAETFRKMIVAMARDIRVLLIKLADRLHNMSTLEHMPREKQKRIAQETLDIYAPLAHRLGMQTFKLSLEDLGFAALHPKRYEEIVRKVEESTPEREAYIKEIKKELEAELRELRIRGEVTGRPKHYYSVYEKMTTRGKEFDEIHDLVGMRVIVPRVSDCYAILGQVHTRWRPVPGRFKDYIANPKFNLYQSLHTSVIGPSGRPLEVQIRTRAMHQTAEYGVAAHWKYKDGNRGGGGGRDGDDFPWLEQLLDWQEDVDDPTDYLESLKIDLYEDEVFVFTPDGDPRALPTGATPIDFAYAIHTEVGHRCIGARVNGRLVSLDHVLHNGDTVEVLTSKAPDAGPSRDWLRIVTSTRARSKIRAFFNRERREDAVDSGREAVMQALRKRGITPARVAGTGTVGAVAADLSYKDKPALFRAVAEGHVTPDQVATAVQELLSPPEDDTDAPVLPAAPPIQLLQRANDDVEVDGDAGMLVKLARCCTPVPGDDIIGFVTRGRGVSVHRRDCSNVEDLSHEPERLIDVDWSAEPSGRSSFLVGIEVEAFDRKHLLRDITAVLGDLHINITSATVHTRQDRQAMLRFTFELADPAHLDYALKSVHRVDGVYDAYRLVPDGASKRSA